MSAELSSVATAFETVEASPRAEQVEWLIDNADAYRALVSALRGAHRTIWISQLALDADCIAYDVVTASRTHRGNTLLVSELLAAARRGVQVRILLNTSLLLDTAAPLRVYLAAAGTERHRVRVRGVSRFPQLLHAKMVIVDEEEAFLVGSPFANGYWDDTRHAPVDKRRPDRELGGRPVHDVSTRLTGAPAESLGEIFAEMWNDAENVSDGDHERLAVSSPRNRGDDDAATRIVRTVPGDGPMEILPALLDGISRAWTLIYIEHQYLSARLVVDALVRALEHHRALEIIIVLNQNPDVTAYRGWQNARLREAGLLDHPRVGLFALWTSAIEPASARRQLNQLFVHSKVVSIDDRWATVGSANLDGVSLHSYGHDFTGVLGRRIFRDVRNFDVNAVIDSRHGGAQVAERVRALRARLWQEHLGASFHAAGSRPNGGWLPLWRSIAARNVEALSRSQPATFLDRSFVLPYSTRSTPRAQLADAGVLFAPESLELCFQPSWLEVHFSPNWFRNMFA